MGSKGLYYFSHDYGARNDLKLLKVRKELGMEGVGLFWCLVEMLYEEGGKLKINEIENYADSLNVKPELIWKIIDKKFALFCKNRTYFLHGVVIERLRKIHEKRTTNTRAANIRWGNTSRQDDYEDK